MEKQKLPPLVVKRLVNARRDRVFKAWTDSEMMKVWFFCGEGRAEVTNDLKVGGSYRNEMFLGGACGAPEAKESHVHFGEYLEIVPPEKIVFTWSSAIVSNSVVTVELHEIGAATEVVITHELLDTELLKTQHQMGWDGCLENLERYFS